MTKDEIQVWMLIAFITVTALSLYKLYKMFNQPATGLDSENQYAQLEVIIVDFLKHLKKTDIDSKELFDLLIQEDRLSHNDYKNFNHNRLNQILQQLFYTHTASTLNELISIIHQSEPDTSKENGIQ